ncbi:uncharacterized protein LOC119179612 isoform X1 [Rhipicephalus microplus]|uniref:uncharacterized protein LOC119179612 isoform X1 n=1 Tax=Rhipicephalus microplus TaxID=6941 RepID=UPI003F6C072E
MGVLNIAVLEVFPLVQPWRWLPTTTTTTAATTTTTTTTTTTYIADARPTEYGASTLEETTVSDEFSSLFSAILKAKSLSVDHTAQTSLKIADTKKESAVVESVSKTGQTIPARARCPSVDSMSQYGRR